MSAHTPGPWQRSGVRQKLGDEDCIRVGPDGFAIAFLPIGRRPNEHAGAIADARLIAAAPDLLVLLRRAREALACAIRSAWEGSTDADMAEHVLIKKIDAAIAKATGSQS